MTRLVSYPVGGGPTDSGRGQSSSRLRVRSMSWLILASMSSMVADSDASCAMASFFFRFAATQS